MKRLLLLLLLPLLLAACGSAPRHAAPERTETRLPAPAPAPVAAQGKAQKVYAPLGGGYYKDDGPGEHPPPDIEAIPDAEPRLEALHRFANKPYSVLGRDYVPMTQLGSYRARGVASWYGRKFHGQRTSTGETYDMYGMSAAHPTLPLPSYVRVSNPANGRSVIVRVNDRGPFHADRIIDLSYTAAAKLGIVGGGSATVEVESVLPGGLLAASAPLAPAAAADPIAQIAMASAADEVAHLQERGDARGIYLQLGAFSNRDNAENLKVRLGRELDDLAERLVVSGSRGVYRLSLGPWADQAEARRVAERLRQTFELKSVLVER